MIYSLGVVALIAASASAAMYKEDPSHLKQMWESFKSEFRRSYATMDEETSRFQNFVANLKMIDQRNKEEIAAGGNAVHGITRFSDLTQSEFEAHYLTADPKMKTTERVYDNSLGEADMTAALVDWSGKYTTAVKDQGQCGSCWAFSATEQIESDAMRTLGASWILSEEQIVQCDSTSYGCNGGWTEHAYNYVQKAGGLATESSYPYTSYNGVTGTCKSASHVVKVTGYTTVKGESQMASYVQSTGPLSVCVDASNWSSYSGGILKTCGHSVNHCVQAVGVDTSAGYWKVRNSWGTRWGESGYIRLAYGSNTCAITNDPTHVSVARA